MNSDSFSQPPSNSNIYQRLASIDNNTNPTTYTAAPNLSSNLYGHSDPYVPVTSQRTLPQDQPLSSHSRGLSGVRGQLNSNNNITSRGVYSANEKSPGMSDLVHKNMSDNNHNGGGVGGSQQKQPNLSDLVNQRDKSNNGGDESNESGESVDPRDYVGISLVGRKFKQVNPEAYYVEKDDQ